MTLGHDLDADSLAEECARTLWTSFEVCTHCYKIIYLNVCTHSSRSQSRRRSSLSKCSVWSRESVSAKTMSPLSRSWPCITECVMDKNNDDMGRSVSLISTRDE